MESSAILIIHLINDCIRVICRKEIKWLLSNNTLKMARIKSNLLKMLAVRDVAAKLFFPYCTLQTPAVDQSAFRDC